MATLLQSPPVTAATAKHQVAHLLTQLPDDCTLTEIAEGVSLIQRLRERTEQADNPAQCLTQEEAEQRMAKWIIK